jgi:hypothetical protein
MARHKKGNNPVQRGPSPDDPYDVFYFRRHVADDPKQSIPARDEIDTWDDEAVVARVRAVLMAVAGAPPLRFSGGGMWEAMKKEMSGYHEVRVRKNKKLYRVFCRLDSSPVIDARGTRHPKNVLVIIAAGVKPNDSVFTPAYYEEVRSLGNEYLGRTPRSWA